MEGFIEELKNLQEGDLSHYRKTEARTLEQIESFEKEMKKWVDGFLKLYEEKNYTEMLFVANNIRVVFPEIEQQIEILRKNKEIEEKSKKIVGNQLLADWLMTQVVCGSKIKEALLRVMEVKNKVTQKMLHQPWTEKLQREQSARIEKPKKVVTIWSDMSQAAEEVTAYLEKIESDNQQKNEQIKNHYIGAINATVKRIDAFNAGREDRFYEAIVNTRLQLAKLLMSQDPEILKLQKSVVEVNQQCLISLGLITTGDQALSNLYHKKEDVIEGNPAHDMIARFYDYAAGDIEKAIELREKAMDAFLVGKKELKDATLHVADLFLALALAEVDTTEAALEALASAGVNNVDVAIDLGLMLDDDSFCYHEREAAVLAEENLMKLEATLPVDSDITSLPWNFRKTFEENKAALERAAAMREK